MTPSESSQPPAPAPRRRKVWPWIAGLLLIAVGMNAAWRISTLLRAEEQLRAAGFSLESENSMVDLLRSDWRAFLKSGLWLKNSWHGTRIVDLSDSADVAPLRHLRAVSSSIRRIQPDSLYLDDCTALENLDGLEDLTGLKKIYIDDCPALQNVDGIGGLPNLDSLDLFDCTALENLDCLKSNTSLRILFIKNCPKLSAESIATLQAARPHLKIEINP